ncbi:protein mono-ADP-ribosyltransferase TIPARP-like [Diprion similis]|uniref:protein mono-ADP-ribosyltransferase TIPARP-like n=1 Tax=Diprion similis TaxID=362088 RepID=UPI001EF8B57E|nr:protein mono-ADP-ribosyltransferase TIPARP-like [Diprion similis]XP_046744405.1 protein mono-ADP-ribosyltransferase TIPARP-like [Diprion similis]
MELFHKAKHSNNFGLRKYYPWSGYINYEPWVTGRVSNRERRYVWSHMQDVFCWDEMTIKRIENPFLWARYVLRYEEMRADSASRDVSEEIVIHATSISSAYKIADNNFNWRLARRCRFGHGVSFARDADYAEAQASDNEAYIIAGILVANSDIGNYGTHIPSYFSDTTVNRQDSVCVKYNDNEYYPYYMIY